MLLTALCSLPLLAAYVSAHARMSAPTPWLGNGFLSANNCNAGTARPPTVTWVAGQQATITWFIQASDGSGPVTLKIDPTGGVNFGAAATTIAATNNPAGTPNRVNVPYTFTFTVPAANCDTAKGCTIQAKSSSNWVSCVSVRIASTEPAPSPSASSSTLPPSLSPSTSVLPPSASSSPGASPLPSRSAAPSSSPFPSADPTTAPACTMATGLTLCSRVNGKSIQLNKAIFPGADTYTPAMFEALFVQRTHDQEWNNTLIFGKAGDFTCKAAYVSFLCSRMFLSCGETTPTMSSCQTLNNACNPTPEHAFLYNCTDPSVASGVSRLDSYPQTVVAPVTSTAPGTDPDTDPVVAPSKSPKTPVKQTSGAERVYVSISAGVLVAAAFLAL